MNETPRHAPDGRPIPPPHADERTMLESWLDFQRATLALKCAGLDDDQLRTASVEPSAMTLLGLVQHMAEIERNWFQRVFAGQDIPFLFGKEGDAGFALVPGQGIDDALTLWRAEVDISRQLIADATLDESGLLSADNAAVLGDPSVSLRWILIHMIEEYARHNGHADLIRERIDGTTGT
ncbi:DinB family protein [Streptomyces sp. NPDC059070]|uniref:DinB family protein n=1 Tax=unclassified Streptomyces TaxID=2593676 RepID=UPI0034E26010